MKKRTELQAEPELHGLVTPGVGDGLAGGQLEGGDGRKHDESGREGDSGESVTRKGGLADGRERAVGDELNSLKVASDGRGACCHLAAIFTDTEGRILIDLKIVRHIRSAVCQSGLPVAVSYVPPYDQYSFALIVTLQVAGVSAHALHSFPVKAPKLVLTI